MASFITRVELHDAIPADYTKLQAEMSAQGFSTTIVGSDGRAYRLPTAMYASSHLLDVDQVRDLASKAAGRTDKEAIVFVAEWSNASWTLGQAA